MHRHRQRTVRAGIGAVLLCLGALCVRASAVQDPAPAVDRGTLLQDLRVLAADDMQGREIGTPGGEKARAYVARRFRESGLRPLGASFEHPFSVGLRRGGPAGGQGVNVVGRLEGTTRPDEYIVISAHYDHVGVRGGQVFNGADDNASGTAALFAMARYFNEHRPATSLLFVAFDGEEPGLLGSRAFVRTPPIPASAMLLDLNADMVGRDPDNTLYVVGTARQPRLRPFIARVARRAPVRLRMGHEAPDSTGPDDWTRDSDHFSFIEAGIPALYFGVEDYPQHHQPTDDYETITYDFFVRAVETLIEVVREFDRGAEALVRPKAR